MTLNRRTVLAGIGAASVLAGCIGDDDDDDPAVDDGDSADNGDDDSAVDDDDIDDTADGDDDPAAATVTVTEHPEHGEILTDRDEMTLYMFDADEQGSGESACSNGCVNNWPPLTVDEEPVADEGVAASLSTFERDDGALQVAADGWPLYYWAGDNEPGDATGQGVNDVWWVLSPDGTPIRND